MGRVSTATARSQVACFVAEPHWTAGDLLSRLDEQPVTRVKLCLLFGLQEISGEVTLGDAGIIADAEITLVRHRVPLVLTGSGDGSAKIWSCDSGECLKTLQGHSNTVKSAAFSPF